MKKILFLFLSLCFFNYSKAQVSNLEINPKGLTLTAEYGAHFWAYHIPVEIEYLGSKGIMNPAVPKNTKTTFHGDSILITFAEKSLDKKFHIIRNDAKKLGTSIRILHYEKVILNSNALGYNYIITGKEGGTSIEVNIEGQKVIQIEEGEEYEINIQLFDSEKEMKPGAYPPPTKAPDALKL